MADDQNRRHTKSASEAGTEQGDIYSKYLLYSSRKSCSFSARTAKGNLITVYFDQGQSFLLTSLIEITPETGTMVFDLGSDNG